jgi:hypothetical protein
LAGGLRQDLFHNNRDTSNEQDGYRGNLPTQPRPKLIPVPAGIRAGTRIYSDRDAAALEEFPSKRRLAEPDPFAVLSLAVVKRMGRGDYEGELPGAGSSIWHAARGVAHSSPQ